MWGKYDIFVSCIAHDFTVFVWVEFKKGRPCYASLRSPKDLMNIREVWMRLWDFLGSSNDLGYFWQCLERMARVRAPPSRFVLGSASKYCKVPQGFTDIAPVNLTDPAANLVCNVFGGYLGYSGGISGGFGGGLGDGLGGGSGGSSVSTSLGTAVDRVASLYLHELTFVPGNCFRCYCPHGFAHLMYLLIWCQENRHL